MGNAGSAVSTNRTRNRAGSASIAALTRAAWWPTTMMASSQPLARAWRSACATSGIPPTVMSGFGTPDAALPSREPKPAARITVWVTAGTMGILIPRTSARVSPGMWRATSRSCYISRPGQYIRSRARGNRAGDRGRASSRPVRTRHHRDPQASQPAADRPGPHERAARRSRLRFASGPGARRRARRSLQHRRAVELADAHPHRRARSPPRSGDWSAEPEARS